jgi:hypothetical protein
MNRASKVLSSSLFTLALTALGCGSGGSTATMKLQDAPPQGVSAVSLTVLSAEAHVVDVDKAKDADPADGTIDDDTSWVKLTVNRPIDLVAHQGETAADLLGSLDLPAGKITQIRLMLDVSAPEKNTLTDALGTCNLDVSKVDKKGIKINHVFKAFESKAGEKHEVYVDFKLDESMKAKDGCFELDPKLHLTKVKTDGVDVAL